MNRQYSLREMSKRFRGVAKRFGRLAGIIAMLSLVSGTALIKGDDNQSGNRELKASNFCTKTAEAAFTACQSEAEDNYWIDIGNCNNLANAAARADCTREAKAARREKRDECDQHQDGRLEVCKAIGEDPYDPDTNPAMFVNPTQIGKSIAPNPFFLLIPGRKMIYRHDTEEVTVTVTGETRKILGVTCATVRDVVKENGVVIEDTIDWFAQDIRGNVWYFGEISQAFEDGVLVSIDGSWTAGVNGAKPGFAMLAAPAVGVTYRQEFSLANAEDIAKVLSLSGSATVPVASCNGNCLITRESSPIIPDLLEDKYYARGVGFILETKPGTGERTLELVEIIQN